MELIHISIDRSMCKPLQIISLYRPPRSTMNNFINEFVVFLSNINFSSLPLIILGDFNHDFNKLSSKDRLLTELSSFGLDVVNKDSTRVAKSSSTCIDWIVCNQLSSSLINKIDFADVPCSDHRLIYFNYKKPKNVFNIKKEVLDYSSIDCQSFYDYLFHFDIVPGTTIASFIDYVQRGIKSFVPCKSISQNLGSDNYLSKNYFRIASFRDKVFRSYTRTLNNKTFLYFKRLRRICNKIAYNDKKNYFLNEIRKSKGSSKHIWKVYNTFFKNNSFFPIKELKDGDTKIIDSVEICKKFNNFFVSVIRNLVASSSPNISYPNVSCSSTFEKFNFVHNDTVSEFLSNTKPSSVDKSNIPVQLIRMYRNYFSEVLSVFINNSFYECIFPSIFKVSKVVPIFKKGSRLDVSNYRPISVNSLLSKVFEKVVYSQVIHYLNINKLIAKQQFGFVKNSSTEYAFINLISKVSTFLSAKDRVAIIFFDFTKAFDSICHALLLHKLKSFFGFGDNVLRWFHSYLNNRSQYVSVNNFVSNKLSVSYGVPQGSVLGPLLFILFINDLPAFIINDDLSQFVDVMLYADDLCLIVHHPAIDNLINLINIFIKKVSNYCSHNSLFLNLTKTKVLFFGDSSLVENRIVLNHTAVDCVDCFKYLGYTIDSKLTFRKHFLNIAHKIRFYNVALSRSSRFLDVHHNLIIYKAFILSQIIYNKYLLKYTLKSSFTSIKNKLLTSGSIIYNCSRNNITDKVFDLNYIVDYYLYITLFKILKNAGHTSINELVQFKSHTHFTRSGSLSAHRVIKNRDRFHISYVIFQMWTKLPEEIRDIRTHVQFKKKLRSIL